MDKIKKYQIAIETLLKEYVEFFEGATSQVKPQMFADRERNHFQLFKAGFQVMDELVEIGVPKSDLVLGFQPPVLRQQDFKIVLENEPRVLAAA